MPLGEGGKWICDVPMIKKQPEVLVYSFGSHGDLSFEYGMEREIPHVETHVFDFYTYGKSSERNITFHKTGVAGFTHDHVFPDPEKEPKFKGFPLTKGLVSVPMKSLPDIVRDLGHQGRTIDVLKMDIEGCEFGILDNSTMWDELASLGVTVRQIQLELHLFGIGERSLLWLDKRPMTGEKADLLLRNLTSQGFAMFHKEANVLPGANLFGCEFGMLKVDVTCRDADVIDDGPRTAFHPQAQGGGHVGMGGGKFGVKAGRQPGMHHHNRAGHSHGRARAETHE